MSQYQKWLPKWCRRNHEELVCKWKGLDACMERAGVRQADCLWQKLRLLTADLLAEYVRSFFVDENGEFMEKEAALGAVLWKNLILSNCCALQQEGLPLDTQAVITEDDYPEIFKQTLCRMLDNLDHLPFVPRSQEKELCPEFIDDAENVRAIGYRRWRMKGKMPEASAIYFVREEFLKWFSAFCPCKCDAEAVLEYCEAHDPAGYFPDRKKESRKDRIPRTLDDTTSTPSVLLLINRLDFLPDTLRHQLLMPFEQQQFNEKRSVPTGRFLHGKV